MEAKHTPGPWAWGSFGAGVLVVACHPDGSPNKHRPVCNVNSQYTFPLDAETVANANLLSAAPDLLEALRECMADADEYERRSGKKLVNGWPEKARAAIAKALPLNAELTGP